jgi:hypothetical protein
MRLLKTFLIAAALAAPAMAEQISSGMSDGTRYDGPPYSTVGVRAGDVAACREACRGDVRCYAWNYQRAAAGETQSRCELLQSEPTLVWDADFISGAIGRSSPAPDPDEQVIPRTPDTSGTPAPPPYTPGEPSAADFWAQFAMSEGSEAAGEAYASWTYLAKGDGGVTRCAKACDGDDKCRAFNVRSDATLAPKPNVICELKASPGSLLRNPDSLAGLKR